MTAILTQCPKCGGATKVVQIDSVQRKECDHCGPLSEGWDIKRNVSVKVKR